MTETDPWIAKCIFPNSMLPSTRQIGEALEGLFVMEDWDKISAYYDRTLLAWRANFERHWKLTQEAFRRDPPSHTAVLPEQLSRLVPRQEKQALAVGAAAQKGARRR